MSMPVTPAIDRALEQIIVHPLGCWIYTGGLNGAGYGLIGEGRRVRWLVHRLVYTDWFGPIPEGMDLDHLCRVTACCNPAHLEPVTKAENARRQWAAGGAARSFAGVNAAKTHCPHGHEYSPENTRVKQGRRYCRTCVNARRRAKRRAPKGAARL
jgi:hypothetical protein